MTQRLDQTGAPAKHFATAINVTKDRDGWRIETAGTFSDEEAKAVTFQATPEQVIMGEFVAVVDSVGLRIGHVAKAEYVERAFGPAYVVVAIELR